jgi:hypothetical protein
MGREKSVFSTLFALYATLNIKLSLGTQRAMDRWNDNYTTYSLDPPSPSGP